MLLYNSGETTFWRVLSTKKRKKVFAAGSLFHSHSLLNLRCVPLWLADMRMMSYCMQTDSVRISLSVSNLWLAGALVCFGVLQMLWMLSKLANIWDDMNNLNFPLNLGNEITPTVRLMNSVLRHPNKYSLIISTRSHAERGRQGRLGRSRCFERRGHGNKKRHERHVWVLGSFILCALNLKGNLKLQIIK